MNELKDQLFELKIFFFKIINNNPSWFVSVLCPVSICSFMNMCISGTKVFGMAVMPLFIRGVWFSPK